MEKQQDKLLMKAAVDKNVSLQLQESQEKQSRLKTYRANLASHLRMKMSKREKELEEDRLRTAREIEKFEQCLEKPNDFVIRQSPLIVPIFYQRPDSVMVKKVRQIESVLNEPNQRLTQKQTINDGYVGTSEKSQLVRPQTHRSASSQSKYRMTTKELMSQLIAGIKKRKEENC